MNTAKFLTTPICRTSANDCFCPFSSRYPPKVKPTVSYTRVLHTLCTCEKCALNIGKKNWLCIFKIKYMFMPRKYILGQFVGR